MIFQIQVTCPIEKAWESFLNNEIITKWLAIDAKINKRKNGNYKLVINDKEHHLLKDCKIIEINEFSKLLFSWQGPQIFDIVMNFPDQLTHVEVNFTQESDLTVITLEHKGWKSSEDWQDAKKWHETQFWPEKLNNLKTLLN